MIVMRRKETNRGGTRKMVKKEKLKRGTTEGGSGVM